MSHRAAGIPTDRACTKDALKQSRILKTCRTGREIIIEYIWTAFLKTFMDSILSLI